MTIAIGMLHSGGVLMCADTLITTATAGSYQSKIQAYRFHDGCVMFAFAGNVGLAEAAIQRCENALKASQNKRRTKGELAAVVGGVLAREYKTHISSAGLIGTNCDYNVIFAIRSNVDGIELYSTQTSSFTRSRTGFECIGAGYDVGQMLIRPVHKSDAPQEKTWNDAAYAIGVIKRLMPGCIGGEPILLNLPKDGDIEVSGYAHAKHLETYTAVYDMWSRTLLSAFMNLEDDETFARQLSHFSTEIMSHRKQWRDKEISVWSNAPPSAAGIVIDLS